MEIGLNARPARLRTIFWIIEAHLESVAAPMANRIDIMQSKLTTPKRRVPCCHRLAAQQRTKAGAYVAPRLLSLSFIGGDISPRADILLLFLLLTKLKC